MDGQLNLTLVFIVLTVISSYQAFNDPALKAKLMFVPTKVKNQKEYYRLISHGFIHADMMHLFLNMFVLYMFGSIVENMMALTFGEGMGRILYVIIYFLGIIAAALPDYAIHNDNYGYAALGASGTVSGIMLIYTFFDPWGGLCIFFILPMPAIIAAVLYLVYSSRMAKTGIGKIAHNAHLYGAVFGIVAIVLFSLFLEPRALSFFGEMLMAGPDVNGYRCF